MSDVNEIPTWEACRRNYERGRTLSKLEQFIYNNEPAGEAAEAEFREQLAALVLDLSRRNPSANELS